MRYFIFILSLLFVSATHASELDQVGIEALATKPSLEGTALGAEIKVSGEIHTGDLEIAMPGILPDLKGIESYFSISLSNKYGVSELGHGFKMRIPMIGEDRRRGHPTINTHRIAFPYGDLIEVGDGVYRSSKAPGLLVRIRGDRASLMDGAGSTIEYASLRPTEPEGLHFRWFPVRVRSVHGYTLEYQYEERSLHNYLSKIRILTAQGVLMGELSLTYEDRPDPVHDFRYGFEDTIRERLVGAQYTAMNAGLVKEIRISYDPEFIHRSIVQAYEVFSGSGELLDARSFEFSQPAFSLDPSQQSEIHFRGEAPEYDNPRDVFMILDVEGDGVPEVIAGKQGAEDQGKLCRLAPDGIYDCDQTIADNLRTKLFYQDAAGPTDIDGDGLMEVHYGEDLLRIDWSRDQIEEGQIEFASGGRINYGRGPWYDVDYDGVAEKVILGRGLYYKVLPAAGSSVEIKEKYFESPLNDGMGDLNGDRVIDSVELYESAICVRYGLGVMRFAKKPICTKMSVYIEPGPMQVADINGDGLGDLIVNRADTYEIYLNLGERGFYKIDSLERLLSRWGGSQILGLSDLNGNGSTDVYLYTSAFDHKTIRYIDPYAHNRAKRPYTLLSMSSLGGQKDAFTWEPSASKAYAGLEKGFPVSLQVLVAHEQFGYATGQEGGGERRMSYQTMDYSQGVYDWRLRQFHGFKKVTKRSHLNEREILETRHEFYTGEFDGLHSGKLRSASSWHYTTEGEDPIQLMSEEQVWEAVNVGSSGLQYGYKRQSQSTRFESDGTTLGSKRIFCHKLFEDELGAPNEIVETQYSDQGELVAQLTTRFYRPTLDQWIYAGKAEVHLSDRAGKILEGRRFRYHGITTLPIEVYRGVPGKWELFARYQYNGNHKPILQVDGKGTSHHIGYEDQYGYLPTSSTTMVGGLAHTRRVRYDYTAGGKIDRFTDVNQEETRYVYDGSHRLAAVYLPGDQEQPTHEFSYQVGDARNPGQIHHQKRGINLASIQLIDSRFRAIGALSPNEEGGYVLTDFAAFDLGGRQILTSRPQALAQAKLEGLDQRYLSYVSLDGHGRPVQAIHPEILEESGFYRVVQGGTSVPKGTEVWSYSARRKIYQNQEGDLKVSHYDANGRLCAIDDWLDNGAFQTGRGCDTGPTDVAKDEGVVGRVAYAYLASGRVAQIKVFGKGQRDYTYDHLGRTIRVDATDAGVIEWDYDPTDKMVAIREFDHDTTPIGSILLFRDALGREFERRSAVGMALTLQHPAGSRLEYRMFWDRHPELLSKNSLGKLAGLELFEGARYAYDYDLAGNMITQRLHIYDHKIEMGYQYDQLGRLTQTTYPKGEVLTHEYSPTSGAATGTRGLLDIKADYDSLMRTQHLEVKGTGGPVVTESLYHPFLPHKERVQAQGPAGEIFDYQFGSFDALGRHTRMSGWDAVMQRVERSYSFDNRGQLIAMEQSMSLRGSDETIEKSHSFSYLGNGDIATLSGSKLVRSFSPGGRATEISKDGDAYQLGAFSRLQSAPGTKAIYWNAEGHIACQESTEGTEARYSYFPDRKRFTQVVGSGENTRSTLYFNDSVHYVKETGQYTYFIMFAGERIAKMTDNSLTHLVQNQTNATTMAVDEGGTVVDYVAYAPYGEHDFDLNRTSDFTYRVGGSLGTDGFDLTQLQTRYYAPGLGMFASADPMFLAKPDLCQKNTLSCNLQTYAANAPTRLTDATGLYEIVQDLRVSDDGRSALFTYTNKYGARVEGFVGGLNVDETGRVVMGAADGGYVTAASVSEFIHNYSYVTSWKNGGMRGFGFLFDKQIALENKICRINTQLFYLRGSKLVIESALNFTPMGATASAIRFGFSKAESTALLFRSAMKGNKEGVIDALISSVKSSFSLSGNKFITSLSVGHDFYDFVKNTKTSFSNEVHDFVPGKSAIVTRK